MEEVSCKIESWVRDYLIPQLAKGEPNVEFTIDRPSGNYFLSETFFMSLRSSKSGEKKMLVKIPSQDPEIKVMCDYDTIFANEISFYEIFGEGNCHYPVCYLAGKDPIFKNLIVLEDVRPRGYLDSPGKVNVHIDYVIAGLKAIARFHAHSYALKDKKSKRYHQLVRSFHDCRFQENPYNERFREVINQRVGRVTKIIRARNDNTETMKKLCNVLDDAFVNVMMECVRPKEPLATIIHGDCTINNLLYRREKKSSEDSQLEAMLIDFGLLMRSSPIVDIATLIYMTCTQEDIKNHSKNLLEIYHSTLVECMKERGIWNASKYSLENFWHEYRSRAVFGFIIASFFRGIMTAFAYERQQDEVRSMREWYNKDADEEVMILLVNMLDDLFDAGMFEDYIGK